MIRSFEIIPWLSTLQWGKNRTGNIHTTSLCPHHELTAWETPLVPNISHFTLPYCNEQERGHWQSKLMFFIFCALGVKGWGEAGIHYTEKWGSNFLTLHQKHIDPATRSKETPVTQAFTGGLFRLGILHNNVWLFITCRQVCVFQVSWIFFFFNANLKHQIHSEAKLNTAVFLYDAVLWRFILKILIWFPCSSLDLKTATGRKGFI